MPSSGYPAIHQARVWLDEDGRHIWLSHDCDPPHQKIVVTMLPDTWSADAGGNIEPSINCMVCGLHYFAVLDAAERHWLDEQRLAYEERHTTLPEDVDSL